METDEDKALVFMQQIRARGKDQIVKTKEKKWEEKHKLGRGEEGRGGREEERDHEDCGMEEYDNLKKDG